MKQGFPKFVSHRGRTASASVAVLTAVVFALISTVHANAIGAGEVSAAVLYERTSPIGSIREDLDNEDDLGANVAFPLAINNNGVKANPLCVTTKG